jgi:predicted metalloprotease
MTTNEDRDKHSVDGPTAMEPTTGHFDGPTAHAPAAGYFEEPAAAPATPAPDEPTSTDPTRPGPATGQAPPGPTPLDEPTFADLATYGPTSYLPTSSYRTPTEPPLAHSLDEPTTNHSPTPPIDPAQPSPLDGPTVAAPVTANGPIGYHTDVPEPPQASPLDGPTIAEPITANGPIGHHTDAPQRQATPVDGPTVAEPITVNGPIGYHADVPEPPQATPTDTTLAIPFSEAEADDEPTSAVGTDEPTTTGPTVGSWPFDEFEPPPPTDLVWQPEHPTPPPATRSPAYYLTLGAAVVLVVGLVALAVVVTIMRPSHEVAGSAIAEIPQITTSGAPAPTTSATAPTSGPFADVAAHPLSSSTTRMADATCALPRFDPADDKQAAFFAAAKVCADNAWRNVLQDAKLTGEVKVVVVTGAVPTDCGDLAPTTPSTECDGTVYIVPAYLRDTEQNGRYPGRYLGVFLREYARALQDVTGLSELVGAVTTGSDADLDTRIAQQATCLAGVVSGSMASRGAIDSNITGEIRARLTTVDAPKDAQTWLDKGFQQRTPAACDTWVS